MNEFGVGGSVVRRAQALRAAMLNEALPAEAWDSVDELRALEELSNALAARRARVTMAFVAGQKADQVAQGVPTDRVGRGVAA
jgi:hypothetical protein